MPLDTIIGLIVLFFSMIVQVIVPPIPAELIVISAGKLYGVLVTTLVAGAGLYLGSVIAYYLGFYLHRRFDRFFERDKVQCIIKELKKYQTLILWIRVLPYNPSDIIAYAAGIIHLDRRAFLTITILTSLTRCFLLALLGSFITGLKTLFGVLVVLVLSMVIVHVFVFRKNRKK